MESQMWQANQASQFPDNMPGVQQTTCCIVGGGPAGAFLGLLLARQGIPVTILEAQEDFERDFRADTIHPGVLELMHDLGLIEQLHQFQHSKMYSLVVETADGPVTFWDFRRLKTRYPYIMVVPQSRFLELLTSEARRYPNFRLVMGAKVYELVQEDGAIRGVRYRTGDTSHEVRALLTIAADGRSSRVCRLAGLEPVKLTKPLEILWFHLPHRSEDTEEDGFSLRFKPGHLIIYFDRYEYWQVGFHIPHGTYRELRGAGLEALRQSIAEAAPRFADRLDTLQDWHQLSLLSVQSAYLDRWYLPGLLAIGDAAHVMTPVGAVGVNMAIQDAVVAANVLSKPLQAGQVSLEHLSAVQRQRERATKIVQRWQKMSQRQTVDGALDRTKPLRLPTHVRVMFRLPILRNMPARLVGFGIWPARMESHLLTPSVPTEPLEEQAGRPV